MSESYNDAYIVNHLKEYGNVLISEDTFESFAVLVLTIFLQGELGKKVKIERTRQGNIIASIVEE